MAPLRLQLVLQDPEAHLQDFRYLYFANTTINLNGEARLTLCHPKSSGDVLKPDPFNSLQVLFSRDDLRQAVREILKRAFDKYFVIIPTFQGRFQIAFADRAPISPYEEQGMHLDARTYYASAKLIDQFQRWCQSLHWNNR